MPFSSAPMWRFNQPNWQIIFHVSVGIVVWFTLCAAPMSRAASFSEYSGSFERGQKLYQQACLLCHGKIGQGDGPDAFYLGAYSSPRPRDFTAAEFKFRSTPSGQLPTDYDLFKTITSGIPGYMPSFRGLSETDRWDIVGYVKSFSSLNYETNNTPIILPTGAFPPTAESVNRGRELFGLLDCAQCHGPQAIRSGGLYQRGELRDRRGLDVLPPDFQNLSSFKNGHRPQDIAQSILTGLDGTPMPSFREALSPHPKDIWHLVNYLISLSRQ